MARLKTPQRKQPRFPKKLELSANLSLKAVAGDGKQLPKLRIVVNTGKPMMLPNFPHPVVVDFQGARFAKDQTPIILEHDTERRIGHCLSQKIGRRIEAEAVVSSTSEDATGLVADLANGYPFEASLGAMVERGRMIRAGQSITVNGRTFEGPLVLSESTVIKEISVCVIGADGETSTILAKHSSENHNMARKTTRGSKAPVVRNVNPDVDIDRNRIADEEERIDGIRSIFAKYAGVEDVEWKGKTIKASSLKASAIRNGIDPREVEIALLQASYPKASSFGNVGGNASALTESFPLVLQAALAIKAGYGSQIEKAMGKGSERVLEAANKLRGATLLDFCRMGLQARGIDPPIDKLELIRASNSTLELPNALGDSLSKVMGVILQETPATWRAFAAKKDLDNFREHSFISPIHWGSLKKTSASGPFDQASMGESVGNLRLETYGERFGIGRPQILADDLGVFDILNKAFAVKTARCISDIVWETILANASSHFASGNGNYLTGADSALSIASLTSACVKMRTQRWDDGTDLDIIPTTLVVSPELENTGRAILKSIELARDGSEDNQPTANPLNSIADLQVEPRISNTTKWASTASTTKWYLFSKPAEPVYVGFLGGKETPTIDRFDDKSQVDFLGVVYRIFLDVGVSLGTPQGGVMSDGAVVGG